MFQSNDEYRCQWNAAGFHPGDTYLRPFPPNAEPTTPFAIRWRCRNCGRGGLRLRFCGGHSRDLCSSLRQKHNFEIEGCAICRFDLIVAVYLQLNFAQFKQNSGRFEGNVGNRAENPVFHMFCLSGAGLLRRWSGRNRNQKRKRRKKCGPSLTLRVVIRILSTVIAEKSTRPIRRSRRYSSQTSSMFHPDLPLTAFLLQFRMPH